MAPLTHLKSARAKACALSRQDAYNPSAEIERQIKSLEDLDIVGLRWAWSERTGRRAPENVGRDLLLRALVYRLQVRAFGDLDRPLKRLLDRVADGDLSAITKNTSAGDNLKPGTILVREYRGETHRVVVEADGYGWDERTFKTLSAVAKAITGSNWNGYVFFGLKTKAAPSDG